MFIKSTRSIAATVHAGFLYATEKGRDTFK